MNSINDRIRILRKHLKLTQPEFGKRIGITTQQQMTNIERGISKVTESNIKLICIEFAASETWLREGVGEMFDVWTKDSVIEQLAKEYNLSEESKSFIKSFVTKRDIDREKFLNALNDIRLVEV